MSESTPPHRGSRVWLVTGSSRGLGREIVSAALDHSDFVVATARKREALGPLVEQYGEEHVLPATLDVTDPADARRVVNQAVQHFGRIDVVVNNAGYANSGPIEELSDEDLRAQIETNLFGVINVTRAALPVLRHQRSGLFLQLSSVGGRVGGTPGMGAYQTAKFGVEGFSEVLANETRSFGVRVLIVEPGAFRTEWQGSSMTMHAVGPDYRTSVGAVHEFRRTSQGRQPGDPTRAARLLVDLADRDELPLRLPLGSDAIEIITTSERRRLDETTDWAALSRCSDFPR